MDKFYKVYSKAWPRRLFLIAALLGFASLLLAAPPCEAKAAPLAEAASYALISADTGELLAEGNGDLKRFPASTTKLMTMTLVMEAIKNGEISLDDQISTSAYAASMGGSQVYLEAGEQRSLKEMLIGIAVGSGNDACVAVAEFMSGSEEAFVQKMNDKAKELSMSGTNFVNPHGLHNENHYTTANDLAKLAYYALKSYPEILDYTSIYEYQFRPEPKPLVLWSTNKLLKWYPGCDGLKTGYTSNAGRNLVATAQRNGMRIISVVMGVEPKNGHFKESIKLLDYAFNSYTFDQLYDKGDRVCAAPVRCGKAKYVDLVTADTAGVLSKKTDKSEPAKEIKVRPGLQAPLKAGEVLGEVQITSEGKSVTTKLIAASNVPRLSLVQCFAEVLSSIFILS